MHIRAQNAALIVRRLATADLVLFEVFEVLPLIRAVMEAEGKLLCSYPGPAIHVPADIFMDKCFLRELSSFLVQMDVDDLSSPINESVHPKYISELLVAILRGCGQPADVDRITKRIGDEVLLIESQYKPWRRSPLWLTLRVSLQSSLRASNLYKPFILFFHAHLLRACVHQSLPSELLYVMRVKMARRLSKLGPAHSRHVSQFVHDTAIKTEAILSKRWMTFQDVGSISPELRLEGLDFVADSRISLDNSYSYLRKMLRSPGNSVTRNRFTPSRGPRLYDVHDFTRFADGKLAEAIAKDPNVVIADFELSVERNLESWIAASKNNDSSSGVIASCIEQYLAGAKKHYGSNAEDNSIMILTLMDLWMALDRCTIQECPLLKEYSPEIPSNFLHRLLLHRSSTLRRALRIEEYLCLRHEEALDFPSIFSGRVDDSCFAVKYFRTSKDLQRLSDAINMHAQQGRVAKQAELASLKQKAKSLVAKASTMDHGQFTDELGRHGAPCLKCRLEDQAKDLRIDVYEWPLPSSIARAQITVFELSPPHAFSIWRDVTYAILHDIGPSSCPPSDRPRKDTFVLDSYSDLKRWAVQRPQRHRVTLAALSMPVSHRVLITAEESSIFINNRYSFWPFDRDHRIWVIDSSLTEPCVPFIPTTSPYNLLHRFVSCTEHTPNDIITAQADCPQEINLHEFIAFSGLRCGPRLQWLNIARELASPFLSFNSEEVHTLISQAAWQLGPLSEGVREWHTDLGDFGFGNALIYEMECLLEKIKENWLEEVTIRTIGMSGTSSLYYFLTPSSSYLQPYVSHDDKPRYI